MFELLSPSGISTVASDTETLVLGERTAVGTSSSNCFSFTKAVNVYTGDIDRDGDIDVFSNAVYINHGTSWVKQPDSSALIEEVRNFNLIVHLMLFDMDGDGYLDLVTAAKAVGTASYFMTAGTFNRQVRAPG